MTDDRSLERAARSFVEVGPTRAPEAAVDAALLRIQTTPQERDWHVLRRTRPMPFATRLLAAAIAIALVVVGGAILFRPGGGSTVGNGSPRPSPARSAEPSAVASPSQTVTIAPAPDLTLGDWQAMSDATIPGLFALNEHIQLSIDWQEGKSTWIQTSVGQLVLKSDSVSAPPNEIDLVTSTGADATGCGPNELGRYTWARSADGLFLTLTALDDGCASRRLAMARTWVHSLSAVTDGKTGVLPFEGWLRMTLPSQRFGLGGPDGITNLRSMEGPERGLLAIADPMGIDAPCGATRVPIAIPKTTAGFVSYVRSLPGFTATMVPATVGGHPAVHVTIRPKGSAACNGGDVVAFHGSVPTATDAEWPLAVGQSHSMWIVDMSGRTDLFIYEGAGVTPDEETSVISSFQFLTDLPTP